MEVLVPDRRGELSMGDDVGVAADGRREVRVNLAREAIVPEFGIPLGAGAKILGGEHTAGGEDADQCVEEGFLGVDALVKRVGQCFRRVHAEGEALSNLQLVLELFKVCRRRSPVTSLADKGKLDMQSDFFVTRCGGMYLNIAI